MFNDDLVFVKQTITFVSTKKAMHVNTYLSNINQKSFHNQSPDLKYF